MTTILGNPGSGAGQTSLQRAYENSGGANPMIQLSTVDGTFTIRDDATPLADMFALQNNGGTNFFAVDAAVMDYGLAGNRGYEFNLDPTGREGIRFLPDGRTQTTAAIVSAAIQWDSTVITDIPGGLPFGNDTAPAMIASIGECQFDEPGNLFSSSLLFNQASVLSANGVNIGPVYTMVNQPQVRNIAAGSRTVSQANAVRSQMRVGPNTAGNITLTSHEPIFITCSVDAAVGTASVTTMNYLAPKAPNLLNGGTVGTLNCLDLPNIPGAGITTLRGINSAMSSGDFIRHTGTAPVEILGGGIHMGDSIPVQFGGAALNSQDASIFWSGGNTLDFFFAANSDSVAWSNPANGRILQNYGANELTLATDVGIVFGDQTTGLGNQAFNFVMPALTPGAGSVDGVLQTQSGNFTNDGEARAYVSAWTVNGFSYANSTGSVTEADTLRVGGMVTSSPGVTITDRQSLHVIAGRSRFDSALQFEPINPAGLSAGDNDDWGGLLTGSANNNMRHWARVTPDGGGTSVITGIDATEAQDGDCFKITNIGSVNLTLGHQDTGSTATNRIISPTAADYVLAALQSCEVIRDVTTDRWRILYGSGA